MVELQINNTLKVKIPLLIILFIGLLHYTSKAQLVVDNTYTPEQLVQDFFLGNGVDVSNANTILINNAHDFGLSDLHQMRGRVGRSNKESYCYLIAPNSKILTDISNKRINSMMKYSDLGSGLKIALRDLDIRGAGNLLGEEQSGQIRDVGYELYQSMLEETISKIRGGQLDVLTSMDLSLIHI